METATKQRSKSAPPPPTRSTPLWIASRPLLAGHGEEFFSHWQKAARSFQEEDIHDLRVASRRLREGLALFAPLLPPRRRGRMDRQVKKVTRMLGELRNTDEALLFFSALTEEETPESRPEVGELLEELRGERELALKRLKKGLRSLDPKPLRREFRAIGKGTNVFRRGEVDPFMAISLFSGGALLERERPLGKLIPLALHEEDGASQHQLRIAVKKLRYRLEIVAPLLRYGYEELHGALKGYQDLLGKLHDLDVFSAMVRDRLREGAGKEELLRLLSGRRRSLHRAFLERLDSFPLGSVGERAREAL